MKFFQKCTSTLIAISFLIIGSSISAQVKIATFKSEQILKEYKKAKDLREKMDVERLRINEGNEEKVASIKSMTERLKKLHKMRSDATISDKKKKEIEASILDLTNKAKEADYKRRQWVSTQSKAVQLSARKKDKALAEIIKSVVREQAAIVKADLVLDASRPSVFHANEAFDITPQIIENLNKETPLQKK